MNSLPALSPATAAVFHTVLVEGPISRLQIASRTKLTPGAVTKAMQPLIRAGYVTEHRTAANGVGRPAGALEVRADREFAVGVKITAQEVIGVVCDLHGRVHHVRHGLLGETGVEYVVDAVRQTTAELLDHSPDFRQRAHFLGVSLSGDVEHRTGKVPYSPFLGWHDVPLADLVRAATDMVTIVENDVRSLTVAERWFGVGAAADSFALVTVGAGIGCGLFVNGAVVSGSFGVAGEIGHLTVEPDGPLCHCGNRGCVEAVASEAAILEQLGGSGRPGSDIGAAIEMAHEGDPAARQVFARAGRAIGLGLASVVNLFGPERVVISGEGLAGYDLFETDMRETFTAHAFGTASRCELVVRPHSFDDWARGAAAVAIQQRFSAGR